MEIKDVKQLETIWQKAGKVEGGEITVKDVLDVPNASVLMPKVMTNIVKEAVEPLLVGTSLLQRINYSYGLTISFPATGALVAADIADGQEYPERSLQIAGGTVTAKIGKSGLAVKFTDEMIKYSQFDVMGMHLRQAGYALARHKEVKIWNYIRAMGMPVFDNLTPSTSLKGVCTGRDLSGTGNGSVTMDDLFDTYAQIVMQGFIPDTLIMHPLTWAMFAKDATLRYLVLNGGNGSWFATWRGSPAGRAPWDTQGGQGVSGGQTITPGENAAGAAATSLYGYPQTINSAPNLPGYMNIPFRIVVSPFVPFDPRRLLTDIYMCDSSNLGAIVVDEDVTMEEWRDPRVDIQKVKLRERYGIVMFNEGKGIGALKNVHVVPNEVVLPAQATISVSGGGIPVINPTDTVI